MAVKISGSFKKDERPLNGLSAIAKDLIDSPYDEHYIIAKVSCLRIAEDIEDGGTKTPTVKLKHIEVMLTRKDEADARKIFERAAKARLGELPQQTLFDDKAEDKTDGEPGEDASAEGDPGGEPGEDTGA